jgi:hypothetical protein
MVTSVSDTCARFSSKSGELTRTSDRTVSRSTTVVALTTERICWATIRSGITKLSDDHGPGCPWALMGV